MKTLSRHVVEGESRTATIAALQNCLADLIDLALQGKQAHWNVVGSSFRAVHLQLDEIIATTRDGSDAVAERIVTLGDPAEGLPSYVAEKSRLAAYPSGLQSVSDTVTQVADRLQKAIQGLREAIETVSDLDPISEDLLVGLTGALEKHLWMVQAQEA
ncbi:Fine tangled pili major subunit [Pseudobythopirellula maris]|uniref:Fine tangled pili major subunit n=1 Tax=Pseudobythopirellula maris TaxID=2527991 RepID=A0A5C5ZV27_9BACT|nr:DNA starvation/stationary phase protection protein Dps [Pseudobythopirellula maris]TWT90063.1 Fine tangled pili major subunit [Pseudobythopirellula maris]